ncbi:hypothetical protein CASFOL_040063 [Castilleja foliolosa]|uniref:ATP-dependent DNA helicase n=1 Tax=Castilleja foliolosa TaxID=1961234 RepID=A0ABD3BEZ9_9LAMI
MTGKRRLNATTCEVGESSRTRRSRRMSQIMDSTPDDATPPTYNYLDNGDCKCICEHCAALFWFAERAVCGSTLLSPKYTHCCKRGAVRLPLSPGPPDVIRQLFENDSFMDNIRAYNNMFSMTSLGVQIDDAVNDGRGPYVFKVSGQICHWIGSLCPPDSQRPRFFQMYIYDTINEVSNRMRFFNSSDHHSLSEVVVQNLSEMLSSCNNIRLYNNVGDRRYAPPAPGTLGGIVRADDLSASGYDIVVHRKDGTPHRQVWSPTLSLHSISNTRDRRLTLNMYYSYQIQVRHRVYSLLLRGGRLLQQYLVDIYTCIEQNRLDYINANQNIFRSDFVAGVYDALARGDRNVNDIGKHIFLPSSFTGGPRYMYKHYQDALAICRVHGNPQYFITFTCNVKWPEISRHMTRIGTGHAQNRPDIIARVFHIKVQEFFKFLRSDKPFGEVAADLYTIEFQKRGLPHCHTLLWVAPPYKIRDASAVDKYVTAEIPDPSVYPTLHKVVTDYMIHGPCGLARPSSPCMRDNKCTKSFPKNFEPHTRFDKDGYVHYKRDPGKHCAIKNGVVLDNRSNETDTAGSSDAAARAPVDEINFFVDGRYICPHEASWRIFNFPIHERNPSVELLAVHLEDMQNVTFKDNSRLEVVIRNPSFGKTTLTEWLRSNRTDRDGRTLHLHELPNKISMGQKTLGNRLLMEETCYDRGAMATATSHSHALLNFDQLQIILAVAASPIASLLLPSGRTAHSRFKILLELTDQSTCHIKKNTHLSELLRQTTLIIWDEAPMSDRRCFECLDRTLRDITEDNDHPFGGKFVLLGGDFRQTLPVRVKCTRSEIINSTLPKAYLWQHFRLFRLHENLRVTTQTDSITSREMVADFASWLLSVGDGLIGEPDVIDPHNTRDITIPLQYLIPSDGNRLRSLIDFIYDNSVLNNPSPAILSTRAIVCPTNDATDDINNLVLTLTPGDSKIYTSHDVMIPHSDNQHDLEASNPQECLPFIFTRRQFPIKGAGKGCANRDKGAKEMDNKRKEARNMLPVCGHLS